MKYYRLFKIFIIAIPVIILGVLLYKQICPGGILRVDYDFCSEDAFISEFSPIGRVLEIEKSNGECSQRMAMDPVYFDVRLPQSFQLAKLKVWYQKDAGAELKIGPRFNINEWVWQLQNIDDVGKDGVWQIGETEYDLAFIQMDRRRMRFLISSPGINSSGKEIVFKRMEIEFRKDALRYGNFLGRLRSFLNFK